MLAIKFPTHSFLQREKLHGCSVGGMLEYVLCVLYEFLIRKTAEENTFCIDWKVFRLIVTLFIGLQFSNASHHFCTFSLTVTKTVV